MGLVALGSGNTAATPEARLSRRLQVAACRWARWGSSMRSPALVQPAQGRHGRAAALVRRRRRRRRDAVGRVGPGSRRTKVGRRQVARQRLGKVAAHQTWWRLVAARLRRKARLPDGRQPTHGQRWVGLKTVGRHRRSAAPCGRRLLLHQVAQALGHRDLPLAVGPATVCGYQVRVAANRVCASGRKLPGGSLVGQRGRQRGLAAKQP